MGEKEYVLFMEGLHEAWSANNLPFSCAHPYSFSLLPLFKTPIFHSYVRGWVKFSPAWHFWLGLFGSQREGNHYLEWPSDAWTKEKVGFLRLDGQLISQES